MIKISLRSIPTRLLKNINIITGLNRNDIINGLYTVAGTFLGPILITILFKQSDLFAVSLFGALFTIRSDPGGIYPKRLGTMIIGACLLIISYLSLTLVSNVPILIVCLILLWTFSASMLNVFGGIGTRIGTIAVIGIIIFMSTPTDMSHVWLRCCVIAFSAVWAIVIKLWAWPFRPHQPVRDAVADYYRAIRSVLKFIHSREKLMDAEDHCDGDIWQKRISMQRSRGIAYLMIRDLNGKFSLTTWKLYLLLKKADSLFTSQIALYESIKAVSFPNDKTSVQESVVRIMEITDNTLMHVAESIQFDKPVGVKRDLEIGLHELGVCLANLQKKPPETGDYAALLNARYIFSILEQNIGVLKNMIEIIHHEDIKLPARTAKPSRQHSVFTEAWHLLADNISLKSHVFSHSLRLSVTLSIATFIYTFYQIPHGYWMPLTVAIILKPDFHTSRQRVSERVLGTIAGGILAFMTAAFIHDGLALLLLAIVFLFLSSAYYSRSYGIYAFFWTPVVVFLNDLNHIGNWTVALERIAFTLAGGILGVIALYLFLPQWEKTRLPDQIARALSANRRFIYAIVDMYSGKTNQSIDIEQMRQQAIRECTNASAAWQRFANEPESKRENFKRFYGLIRYNQQLCDVLTALSLEYPKLSENDALPGVRLLLQQFIETLHAIEIAVLSRRQMESEANFENNRVIVQNEILRSIEIHTLGLTDNPMNARYSDLAKDYTPFRINLQRLTQSMEGLYQTVGATKMFS